jgi:quercetin dioxygenase-like cupin family protein
MKTSRQAMLALAILSAIVAAETAIGAQSPHVMATLGEAQWGPAPPMLPPGAQIAVLAGDPTKATAYTIRLRFPANYTIPAHSHPTNENVVVVSGDLFVGMGDAVSKSSAKALGLGGFGLLPANMNHFAFTKQETTIVLFGQGPVEFKYVNPADDPRHAAAATGSK